MTDNLEKIKYPACNCEMKKVFIPAVGINVDVCFDGCGGIYFDNREYYKFDEPCEEARQADFTNNIYALVGKEYELIMEANRNWEKQRAKNFYGTLVKRVFRTFLVA